MLFLAKTGFDLLFISGIFRSQLDESLCYMQSTLSCKLGYWRTGNFQYIRCVQGGKFLLFPTFQDFSYFRVEFLLFPSFSHISIFV